MNTFRTTYYPKGTTTDNRLTTNRLRVQCVTWRVVHQPWWFQQEHSVRRVGSQSTQGTWCQKYKPVLLEDTEATTFVGTRNRKLQLSEGISKTMQWSTPLRSAVDRCHVQSTSVEESWLALFARNDKRLDEEQRIDVTLMLFGRSTINIRCTVKEKQNRTRWWSTNVDLTDNQETVETSAFNTLSQSLTTAIRQWRNTHWTRLVCWTNARGLRGL